MNVPDDEDNSYYIQPSSTDSTNPWYGNDYITGFGYRSYWTTEFKQGDTLKFQVRLCSANPDFGDSISDIYSKVTSYTYNTTNAATGATVGDPNSVLVSYNKYNSNCGTFNFTILNPISGRYYGFELSFNTALRISPNSTTSGYAYISSSQAVVTEGTNAYIELMNEQSKQNTNDIINNQNQNNEELKDTINNNFNTCTPSKNLFPHSSVSPSGTGGWTHSAYELELKPNTTYTLSTDFIQTGTTSTIAILSLDDSTIIKSVRSTETTGSMTLTFTTPEDGLVLIRFYSNYTGSGITTTTKYSNIMLNEGVTSLPYEEYGKEVCTNKLDEQVETSKGILGTLKSVFTSIVELPKKIVDLLVDGLKSLFVPDSEELNQLMDDFKATISEKLGVIYQAGDLIISIFQNIIDDNSVENACLTFPELKVPNVDKAIIEETDFCFNEITDEIPILLTTIRGLSGVFITLTFINMLKKKYDDFINGGDL